MAKFDVKALRDKVMASDDVKYEEVYVEEWDVTLPVKTVTAAEMKKLQKYHDDPVRMAIMAILYGCKTKDGEAVFKETDLAKFENEKSLGAIYTVADKILEMSGMDDKAAKDGKNV